MIFTCLSVYCAVLLNFEWPSYFNNTATEFCNRLPLNRCQHIVTTASAELANRSVDSGSVTKLRTRMTNVTQISTFAGSMGRTADITLRRFFHSISSTARLGTHTLLPTGECKPETGTLGCNDPSNPKLAKKLKTKCCYMR